MGKVSLVLLATVLGSLALLFCTLMLAGLVAGDWWYAVRAAIGVFACGGGCDLAIRKFIRLRDELAAKGGEHGGEADHDLPGSR